MIIDPENEKHITADEGKHFVRTVSNEDYGKEIYMGYTYYIGGVLQNPPHLDVKEDFSEIEDTEETEIPSVEEA